MQGVSQVRLELGRVGELMTCNNCLSEASPSASMSHTLEQMLKVYRLTATSKGTRRQAHVYFAHGIDAKPKHLSPLRHHHWTAQDITQESIRGERGSKRPSKSEIQQLLLIQIGKLLIDNALAAKLHCSSQSVSIARLVPISFKVRLVLIDSMSQGNHPSR